VRRRVAAHDDHHDDLSVDSGRLREETVSAADWAVEDLVVLAVEELVRL